MLPTRPIKKPWGTAGFSLLTRNTLCLRLYPSILLYAYMYYTMRVCISTVWRLAAWSMLQVIIIIIIIARYNIIINKGKSRKLALRSGEDSSILGGVTTHSRGGFCTCQFYAVKIIPSYFYGEVSSPYAQHFRCINIEFYVLSCSVSGLFNN